MAKRNTYFEDEKIERKIDLKQFARVLRYHYQPMNLFSLGVVYRVRAARVTQTPSLCHACVMPLCHAVSWNGIPKCTRLEYHCPRPAIIR